MKKKKSRKIKHNESGFHFLLTGNLRIFFYLKLVWCTKPAFYKHKGLQHSYIQMKCILRE